MFCVASAQDADEFDIVEETVFSTPTQKMSTLDWSLLAKQFIPFQNPESYAFEACMWGFGILYLVVYFVGKAQNRKIANKWLEEAEPVLRTQFSYTGSSVKNGIGLIAESQSNFKYFCTGRRFLTRFIADLELKSRHDLISRIYRLVVPSLDYLTIDVGLHSADVDPFILGISKKLCFTALSKIFPELIEIAKQVPVKEVPESMWVVTDCSEIAKEALMHPVLTLNSHLLQSLYELEDFIEYIVITDMNKQLIVGMPRTQKHILRVRFQLQAGSKKLDVPKALRFVFTLIDGAGASIKLSANAKHNAMKRRLKIKQAAEALASAPKYVHVFVLFSSVAMPGVTNHQAERNEKKQKEYESLSYAEQQKIDAKNKKRATRKRFNRKASQLSRFTVV
ncbi:hypothetical protein PsorP6_002054 [Peronosclerospora sorghi]|uniref:Uncharacterized protein n=1 Tax=Peronosclerospora sorghi TaxID=230839 RepID=A0ACC0WY10_9STRA|nr:hypothetical protein PsorP6_002054 [Peronosclerospora sorghi]